MRIIKIGEQDISVQGGPWALVLYEREFSPEHSDFFEDAKKYCPADDLPNPMFLLRIAWAMARNADDSFPPFDRWAKSLDVSLQKGSDWSGEVISAINAEIF